MSDSNPLLNSFTNISQLSSIRDSLRFTPIKQPKPTTEDYYSLWNSSTKRDNNHYTTRTIDLLNDIINSEKRSLSTFNLSLRQKQVQIGYQMLQAQNLRNSANLKKIADSSNSRHFLTRTHSSSAIDIPSSSRLINKHEYNYVKESIEEVKDKLTKLTKEKEDCVMRLNQLTIDLNKIKEKKKDINSHIENKLSQRESFEELYRYNVSKHSKATSNKGLSSLVSPCHSDNIMISKEEAVSLSIAQYKELIITILNDLFESKSELIYYNLIEAAISKAYLSITSFSGPNKAEVFFLQLSKAICDIYPTVNTDSLLTLTKFSVKLHYIDNVIEKDMRFISKEYKSKKKEYKTQINEIKDNILKLESRISEVQAKEKELSMQWELMNETNLIGLNNGERDRSNRMQCNYNNQPIDKLIDQYNYKQSNSNSLLTSRVIEKQIEENALLTDRRSFEFHSTKEKINESDNTLFRFNKQTNNSHNESNSTLYRSPSNTGSAFKRNESTLSSLLDEKISNQCNLSKSPSKIGRNSQSYQSNHFNCSIQKQYPNKNVNNKDLIGVISPNKQLDHKKYLNQNSRFNQKDSSKDNHIYTNNKKMIRSSSSISINPKETFLSSITLIGPKLTNTYCYYKLLTKYDPKYNPLSSSPEQLGYNKGFISFNPIQQLITLLPSSTNTISNNQTQLISISDIKNTIVLNSIKDICTIHRSYQRMLQNSKDTPININHFIQREECKSITMNDNDKIKSALCSFFSFSLLLNNDDILELVFVSYNEFKSWLNGLGNILNSNNNNNN